MKGLLSLYLCCGWQVKDELLAAVGEVYEVALKDGTTFRREGDKPLEVGALFSGLLWLLWL